MRALSRFGFGLALGLTTAVVVGAASDATADTVTEKAGRGLAAITTAFLEVPGQMLAESRRNGPAYGIPVGFARGLGGVVARELAGVFDLVTAPIEIPADRRAILEPEYPWDYFTEGGAARRAGPNLRVVGPDEARRSR